MATVTPNFNFPVPQSTDLVKDGATAIASLGTSIDTQFVDLKGGTTGQILAKASNTDLDYSWITNDVGDITAVTAGTGISGGGTSGAVTITNSMATAIDAKGDLIGGTGADTFARLAVGTDYGFLQADSAETTGLKWNNAAWTTYTPTVSPVTGSITSYTASGRWARIGKLCAVSFSVVITNAGTGGNGLNVSLPFTTVNIGAFSWAGAGRENALTGNQVQVIVNENSNIATCWQYNNASLVSTNYNTRGSIVFEVA